MSALREKAPTILTAEGARRLIGRIRDVGALHDDLLVQAFQGEAWVALGYSSWEECCAAELPELRMLKMKATPRRERVKALRAEGANIPQLAAATGASLGTIHADLTALEGGHKRAAVSELKAPTPSPAPVEYRWQTAVRHVTAAGARGMTCRELEKVTGWDHQVASPALHAAEKKRRVRRVAVFRDGYAAYVA